MSLAFHCDRDQCDTWIRAGAAAQLPNQFVAVLGLDGHALAHCCSLDCLMHWAAEHSEPTTEVPSDG